MTDRLMWIMIGFLVIGMGIPVACGCYLQAKFMNDWFYRIHHPPELPKWKEEQNAIN